MERIVKLWNTRAAPLPPQADAVAKVVYAAKAWYEFYHSCANLERYIYDEFGALAREDLSEAVEKLKG